MFQTVWCYATLVAAGLAVLIALVAMRRRVRRSRMAFGLVVAAALVALAGSLLFEIQSRAAIERREIARTFEMLRTNTRIANVVAHAESGQRGYLLTQDVAYLASFTVAAERIDHEIVAFKDLIAGDPLVEAQGRALVDAIAAKFEEMRSTLTVMKQKSREDSLAIIRTDKGLKLGSTIDALYEDIKRIEQAHLDALIERDHSSEATIGYATAALLLGALITILAASALSHRAQKRRRETQREIEDRNAMFAAAGEIANIGHWRVSIDGQEIFWSDQTFRIHGLDPADGMPSREHAVSRFVPEDRARVDATVDAALAKGEGFQFEARLVRPDGSVVDVVSRGICAKNADGQVTSVFGVLLDITQIRDSQRSLATSERLYRLLAQNITDVIIRFDADNLRAADCKRFAGSAGRHSRVENP